ncbi:AaceriABL172Cp [[Ashbya] aceris (nom. inval.)]|nr:AaceriABL172Cp [[Ashbya] aceris (nom. inval.)]
MQKPRYLTQPDRTLSEKFRYIQSLEDERLRDATLYPEESKWSLGPAVDKFNQYRNRYVNIIPYDRTRVHLQVDSGSDYINASYTHVDVPGQSVRRGNYISTQGPTRRTWQQFWQMCYQQCPGADIVVVMVTPLVEQGREKCHPYWPQSATGVTALHVPQVQSPSGLPGDVITFATDLQVELVSETRREHFVETQLVLRPGNPQLPVKRVHHFYFDQWRDMTRPDTVLPVLELSRRSHSASSPENPIIVHCSAGVGRTGTYITLDHLIHDTRDFTEGARKDYSHDLIEQIVMQLRMQRLKMVQLLQQYEFIYHLAGCIYGHTA